MLAAIRLLESLARERRGEVRILHPARRLGAALLQPQLALALAVFSAAVFS